MRKTDMVLGEILSGEIVTPLLAYSQMLKAGGAYGQARVLEILIEDAQKKMNQVFDDINSQVPDLKVKYPN